MPERSCGLPGAARRAAHAIASRPLKQLLARDQGFRLAWQMYALQLRQRKGVRK
jgi:hypothetical protein